MQFQLAMLETQSDQMEPEPPQEQEPEKPIAPVLRIDQYLKSRGRRGTMLM